MNNLDNTIDKNNGENNAENNADKTKNKKNISDNKNSSEKNNRDSKTNIIKDFGYIKISDKFYEINQSKASLNIIKSSLTLSNFFREYESIVKTIEVYNNAKDDLLIKGYSENFETEIAKFENSIAKEKSKFNILLENTETSLKALLTFYLGKDAMKGELAELNFIDSIKICIELSAQLAAENTNSLGESNACDNSFACGGGFKNRASKFGA